MSIVLVGGSAVIVTAVFCLIAAWAMERQPAAGRRHATGARAAAAAVPSTATVELPEWVRRMLTCPLEQLGRVIIADIAACYASGGAA